MESALLLRGEAMLLLNDHFVNEQADIIAQRLADGQVYERRADDARGLEEKTFGGGGGTMSFTQETGADGVMITRGTSFSFDEHPGCMPFTSSAKICRG